MKKTFATLAFVLAASTAMAADAVSEVPAAPVADVAPAFSWTGFTIGVQGGYNWNNQDIEISGTAGSFSEDFDGGILGGFVGYNYDFGNSWVVGLEADFDKNWADNTAFDGALTYGFDWQGSVRGRVGYAFDRALVYGTAGWAYARGYADVAGFGEEKETFNGYTLGVGLDYAFTDNVFARLEYRYTDFGDKTFDFGGTGGGTITSDIDQHAIRVGLGVKF
ncbi:porin family protein [Agrobacterium tumefaciens]|jgi:outer membrane immunogenic protein|uniref:outer membrane protein n=1 Tax=Agrobacterium TaxID=357 RepID=UPI00129BCD4A|nr:MULTISPECIES: outer membrane protein [Agrobacterium]MCZ7929562.1 porin family protein [Agrobacterium pusense]MRG66468.1 outer membrane beta-barrel protein [Agrobacterium pusense]QTK82733.1 porin family protein [Agrobacterium tumefaciens]